MKVIYLANDKIYINENDRVIKSEIKKEKGIITSSIGYKDIMNITFKLSKTISKDMIEIEAEKYVYTEGSIDYTKEYKINFIFKEYDDYFNVEAFIVDIEVLKSTFEKYLKIYKYIDFISPKPIVFESFYDIVNVIPQNDIFIYIDKEEAFLSCFENGKFVYVKSINKISNLAKELNLSIEETIEILKNKGFDESKYEEKNQYQIIESFFSQFFMKVNNLVNYSVSYYGLSKINRIFFYSSFEISNLFENYVDFWNLSGIEFKKYEIHSDYDAFDYSAMVYNSKNYENENINFSIFPRPIPFYKTKSGILFLVILMGLSGIGIDAFYKYQTIQDQENIILNLKRKISRQKKQQTIILQAIKKYQKKADDIKNDNKNINLQISDLSDRILYLRNIQKHKSTTNQFANLVNILSKYNLKLISMDKNLAHYDILITSAFQNSSNIANFMKEMYTLGYKNITAKEINNNNGIYIAKVSYDE